MYLAILRFFIVFGVLPDCLALPLTANGLAKHNIPAVTERQTPNMCSNPADFDRASIDETTEKAVQAFKTYAWPLDKGLDDAPDGLIQGIGYWQSANAYAAVMLHGVWAGSDANDDWLDEYTKAVAVQRPNYLITYNDDSAWWAIAMLEYHTISRSPRHALDTAQTIWSHISKYVVPEGKYNVGGNDMKGAVMWTDHQNETQVNTITSSLYAELSARLAVFDTSPDAQTRLINAAVQSLGWIFTCLYDAEERVVLDHIDVQTGELVDWTFTYTTGQTIAAAAAVYRHHRKHHSGAVPPDKANILTLASDMASSAMRRSSWVSADGILTEAGAYPGVGEHRKSALENDDAVGFKSILIRSLAKLYAVLVEFDLNQELQREIKSFVIAQYRSITVNNDASDGFYGPWWAGPVDTPTAHSQMAVLDVMAAIQLILR